MLYISIRKQFFLTILGHFLDTFPVPEAFKKHPRSLMWLPRAPGSSQERSKSVPERSKSVPRGSQELPRAPQDAPRAPQDAPRAPKSAPRCSQELPRAPQKAPKRLPGDPKVFKRVSKELKKSKYPPKRAQNMLQKQIFDKNNEHQLDTLFFSV